MIVNRIRLAIVMALVYLALPLDVLAQINDEPDLDDPAVKHGYREGRNDSTRARLSTNGDDYVYVDDAEFLEDTIQVPTTKNPKLAGWMSFTVPGSGQIYNGQYWKVPIIYGAFGSLIYVSQFYNIRYRQLKHDERIILARQKGEKDAGELFFGIENEADVVRYMLRYRRYRDLCYVGMVLVYVMNIFDAVVDAHLYDFDITDDMAFHFEPFTTGPMMAHAKPALGARFVLRF